MNDIHELDASRRQDLREAYQRADKRYDARRSGKSHSVQLLPQQQAFLNRWALPRERWNDGRPKWSTILKGLAGLEPKVLGLAKRPAELANQNQRQHGRVYLTKITTSIRFSDEQLEIMDQKARPAEIGKNGPKWGVIVKRLAGLPK